MVVRVLIGCGLAVASIACGDGDAGEAGGGAANIGGGGNAAGQGGAGCPDGVELMTDPAHCGACGNACASGVCAGGVCAPHLLTKLPNPLGVGSKIGVNDAHVYVAGTDEIVYVIDRLDGVIAASEAMSGYRVEARGEHAVVSTSGLLYNTVKTFEGASNTGSTVGHWGVIDLESYFFFTEDWTLSRTSLAGGLPSPIKIYDTELKPDFTMEAPSAYAELDDTRLAVLVTATPIGGLPNYRVEAVDKGTGATSVIATFSTLVEDIDAGGGFIYLAARAPTQPGAPGLPQLHRLPASGGGLEIVATAPYGGWNSDLHATDDGAYFVYTADASPASELVRVDADGTATKLEAPTSSPILAVATDGGELFTLSADGSIVVSPQP